MSKQNILDALATAVVEMDEEGAQSAAKRAIAAGVGAHEAIMAGLVRGMKVVNDKYEEQEYFIPEVLLCSYAMMAGLDILKSYLPPKYANWNTKKADYGHYHGNLNNGR